MLRSLKKTEIKKHSRGFDNTKTSADLEEEDFSKCEENLQKGAKRLMGESICHDEEPDCKKGRSKNASNMEQRGVG